MSTKASEMLLKDELQEVRSALMMKDKWDELIRKFEKNPDHLMFPMNMHRDSAFHLALHTKKVEPFRTLLETAIRSTRTDSSNNSTVSLELILKSTNAAQNTILHEAATVGNLEVMKLLLDKSADFFSKTSNLYAGDEAQKWRDLFNTQLETSNLDGEVPLFTAAAFGETEIIDFLLDFHTDDEGKIKEHGRSRTYDEKSIVQAAIEGEHPDTALFLLNKDASLAHLKDENGMTPFQSLAKMPTCFRSGYSASNILDHILYFFSGLFVVDVHVVEHKRTLHLSNSRSHSDLESGSSRNNPSSQLSDFDDLKGRTWIRKLIKGHPRMKRIWEVKRKHKYARLLVKKLAELTSTWKAFNEDKYIDGWKSREMPLFTATENGITEIVNEILAKNPETVLHDYNKDQNLLHVAVMHRREKIFHLIRKLISVPIWERLTRKIDEDTFTLLHHAADNQFYTGGTKPGPAFQLQEELRWFELVKEQVPAHYAVLRAKLRIYPENTKTVTPFELFVEKHKDELLVKARKWTKETSQSCSTVAGLVATVVFAAAYTVPGGSDQRSGFPIFLHSPYFMFFTVMDVVALAFSLTSLVAFLSILTSPFEFDDFRDSIPRKLNFGLALLFFSVVATMLTFGATILLIIRTDRDWTTSLISIAAFLPVSVFGLLQFRLCLTLMRYFLSGVMKVLLIKKLLRSTKQ